MTTTAVRPARKRPEANRPDARFASRARRDRIRRWIRRLALLSVIGALGFGVWAVGWSSLVGVRHVDVRGASRLSASDVRAAAKAPIDRPLVRVGLRAIAHRVAALPAVSHVTVTRVLPNTLRITITERVPVAVVRRGDNRRLIAADGVDFAPAPDRTTYPLLDLDVAVVSRDRVSAGLAALHGMSPAFLARMSSLEVLDPTDIRVHLGDGTTVLWGSPARGRDKIAVLAALQKLNPSATTFDVSAPDAPTVRV